MKNTSDEETTRGLAGIRSRLDTLISINAENILIPGGPQEQYHQLVEEAYVALGLLETQVDELRAELEYQHKRLDEARDAAQATATQSQELVNTLRSGRIWPPNMEYCPQSWTLGHTFLDKTAPHQVSCTEIL